MAQFGTFVPFPTEQPGQAKEGCRRQLEQLERNLRRAFRSSKIGAVLVEPIQVRGGVNVPPPGFLELLRRTADAHEAVLILDEIYTGFGRTGAWFACEHEKVAPDIICLGKALTGGFPLSACVGRADLMDAAWPASEGEAIHTSTFLGHPVGCAMALAQIQEIRSRRLVENSARQGAFLLKLLGDAASETHAGARAEVRGRGLLAGMDLRGRNGAPDAARALAVIKDMLRLGFILLPEGEHSNVISFTPPLTISSAQLRSAVANLRLLL